MIKSIETDVSTVGNGNQTAARLNSHDRAERDRTKTHPGLGLRL
jgi:hypothetical protein